MKVKDLLEYDDYSWIDIDAANVLTDPTYGQLVDLLRKTKEHDNHYLRGLIANDHVYVWKAYYAHHAAMKHLLGLTEPLEEIYFTYKNNKPKLYWSNIVDKPNLPYQVPLVKQWIDKGLALDTIQ